MFVRSGRRYQAACWLGCQIEGTELWPAGWERLSQLIPLIESVVEPEQGRVIFWAGRLNKL